MLVALITVAALNGAAGSTAQGAPTPCALLQAAYTVLIRADEPAYPVDLGPSRKEPTLIDMLADHARERVGLTADEARDLAARQREGQARDFLPACSWTGKAIQPRSESLDMTASFAEPILSKDGTLALVEVSASRGIYAHGSLCIMRRTDGAWSGKCFPSWSIR